MERLERWESPHEAHFAANEGDRADIWTSLPGIVVSFDPKTMTAEVKSGLLGVNRAPSGLQTFEMAHFLDVPVHFPAAGGFSLTMPVNPGDECLLVFAQRAIDNWWAKGGVQQPHEMRMHDPSDGFAFLGFRSQPRVLGGLSSDAVQLRSDDGKTFIEIDGNQNVRIVAQTKVRLETPLLEVTGDIKAGVGGQDQVDLQTHTHNGGPPPDPESS